MVTTLMQIIHCVVVNPSGLCCKTPAKKHARTNQIREITIGENWGAGLKKFTALFTKASGSSADGLNSLQRPFRHSSSFMAYVPFPIPDKPKPLTAAKVCSHVTSFNLFY